MREKRSYFVFAFVSAVVFQMNLYAQADKAIPVAPPSKSISYEIHLDDYPLGPNVKIMSIDVVSKFDDTSSIIVGFVYQGPDMDILLINRKIAVLLGYGNDNHLVFEGTINKHTIKQTLDDPGVMTVEAQGGSPGNPDNKVKYTLKRGTNVIEYEFEMGDDIKINAELCIKGMSDILAGDKIKMEGFGRRFDGLYRIMKIQHELRTGQWDTRLTVRKQ